MKQASIRIPTDDVQAFLWEHADEIFGDDKLPHWDVYRGGSQWLRCGQIDGDSYCDFADDYEFIDERGNFVFIAKREELIAMLRRAAEHSAY